MNKQELKKILEEEFYKRDYSLEGGLPEDRSVLSHERDGTWIVYFSERGERNDLHVFSTENEACLYMLRALRSDAGIRRKPKN